MAKVTFHHAAQHLTYVDIKFSGISDTAPFMLASDAHLDSTHCEQDMFRRHLDSAVDAGAHIFLGGDTFDVMQGKFDKRSDRSNLRPEFQGENYLDSVVTYAADFLEPYAKHIIAIYKGNHCTSIIKYNQTDLVERLVGILNDRTKSNILSGGYSGWVFYRCHRGQQRGTQKMWFHHGRGGGGMTRGVNKIIQRAADKPDMDICWTGHTHQEYILWHPQKRINNHGTLSRGDQLHILTPGYKATPLEGTDGWETEREFATLLNGAAMLKLGIDGKRKNGEQHIRFDRDAERMA